MLSIQLSSQDIFKVVRVGAESFENITIMWTAET